MISFGLTISWPWFKNTEQIDYIEKEWQTSKYKHLEVQCSKGGNSLIGFDFNCSTRCSHAGICFGVSFFRYFFMINFYDSRHWNYDKNRYVNYDDPEEANQGW